MSSQDGDITSEFTWKSPKGCGWHEAVILASVENTTPLVACAMSVEIDINTHFGLIRPYCFYTMIIRHVAFMKLPEEAQKPAKKMNQQKRES